MGILTGKKNTPLSNPHLCKSCAWGQFMTGYRDSERLAVCKNTSPNMVIPFAMLECSGFRDRNRPDCGSVKEPPVDKGSSAFVSRHSVVASVEPLRPARKKSDAEDGGGAISIRTRIH
jgi:hypothetical protein